MLPPKRWPIHGVNPQVDDWIRRDKPNEAQRVQLYLWLMDTLALNPLNFQRLVYEGASGEEHVAPIPGSRITVWFILDRERHIVYLTRIETAGK